MFCVRGFTHLREIKCNQFCLRMGTELVPETLYSNELTRLCAREDYIEKCNPFFAIHGHLAAIHGHAQQAKNFEMPTTQRCRWAPARTGCCLVLTALIFYYVCN
jgi:hypothetical protein